MKRSLPMVLVCLAIPLPAFAQTVNTTTGTAGCAKLVQVSADTISQRIAADDANINAPKSVKTLTCLDNFFKGAGLDVITNFLNPTNLLQSIEGQICNAISSAWQNSLGQPQCGITLTGFNLGFGGLGNLGGGLSCPKLTFGGGGPPMGSISVSGNGNGQFRVNGAGVAPAGYTVSQQNGLW
ncbi:hypothetical protein [Beijerinckia indica]|uniref:Uncharacterized protein n=1 Tax=Beijerinckia indica subsp. indica (strain ATCC 9039 / DSM 1715 / NCIMB 8712) TaxID=395963 RepID=B2ILI6_BEII9|nr:hypothetical protein [Beijerinckia indica]ACB97386.1 hypothetical protein Bind_3857 [Beijerinckia indica subsp. indica ATCC 9039]